LAAELHIVRRENKPLRRGGKEGTGNIRPLSFSHDLGVKTKKKRRVKSNLRGTREKNEGSESLKKGGGESVGKEGKPAKLAVVYLKVLLQRGKKDSGRSSLKQGSRQERALFQRSRGGGREKGKSREEKGSSPGPKENYETVSNQEGKLERGGILLR